MRARTSPPSVPRRLHWLALGVNASLAGCAQWLEVPGEPGLEEASAAAVTTVAPPQWHPPLEAQRYFSQHGWPTASGAALDSNEPPLAIDPSGATPTGLPPSAPPGAQGASGGLLDAGPGGAPLEPPVPDAATPDAVSPPCVGHELFGICWYLGEPGASCEKTCAAHGGADAAASAHVGVARQAGSREDCVLVLNALGQRYRARTASREEDGVGCYLSATDGDPYWLSWPPFEPTACLSGVRIACGCSD